jgi:hypothetical protein
VVSCVGLNCSYKTLLAADAHRESYAALLADLDSRLA